jgi:hypothetical protein
VKPSFCEYPRKSQHFSQNKPGFREYLSDALELQSRNRLFVGKMLTYTQHGQKLRFFYQTAFVNCQWLIVNGKEATINKFPINN